MSSADLVIKNHQGIKAEIEARADRFSSCIEMGQGLLARSHYAAEEVGEAWAQPGHLPGAGLNADFSESFCFFWFFLYRNLSLSPHFSAVQGFPHSISPRQSYLPLEIRNH